MGGVVYSFFPFWGKSIRGGGFFSSLCSNSANSIGTLPRKKSRRKRKKRKRKMKRKRKKMKMKKKLVLHLQYRANPIESPRL